jgi:recombinational DNA repair ATPase RecF
MEFNLKIKSEILVSVIAGLLLALVLHAFRGINNEGTPLEIKFRPDAVNSIFAANGLGKSSLFEALTYAISSQASSRKRTRSICT